MFRRFLVQNWASVIHLWDSSVFHILLGYFKLSLKQRKSSQVLFWCILWELPLNNSKVNGGKLWLPCDLGINIKDKWISLLPPLFQHPVDSPSNIFISMIIRSFLFSHAQGTSSSWHFLFNLPCHYKLQH